MQLQNIIQIERRMSDEELSLYINELIENLPVNYPWPESSISEFLHSIREYKSVYMTHPLVLSYIGAYMLENRESVVMSALNIPYLIDIDTNFKIIKFVLNDRSEPKYILMPQSTLEDIIQNVRYMNDNGMLPESFKTRAEIEIDIQMNSNRDDLVQYLLYLGVITPEEANTIIPEQSSTLDVNTTTERFSSALWFEVIQKQKILLAGLGGIGSYVAFLLSRMHPEKIYMYDDDLVEAVNMAGQLYGRMDVGKYKVDAIAEFVNGMSDYRSCFCVRDLYTSGTQTNDVMICGFDNMDARRVFFDNWNSHVLNKYSTPEERKKCLFIDGRLAAEEFQVFCIRGDDDYAMQKYATEYLFSDIEADDTLCSYKQTTYMANMIGSVIVNLFTNFVANSIEDNIRELPFLTTYDGSTMTFKTINE